MRRAVGGIARRLVSTTSISDSLFVTSQSIARILETHLSNTDLPQLNSAVGSIVQLSSRQVVDRMSLTEPRCTDLVYKVYGKIADMSPDDVVSFFDWYSKSRMLKFGWRGLSPSERDCLLMKLNVHCLSNSYSISQLMTLVHASSLLHFGLRTINIAVEQQLINPDTVFHLSDLKTLMGVISKSQSNGGRLLIHIVNRLKNVDFSLVDAKSIVNLYRSLCVAELFTRSGMVNKFVGMFMEKMVEKLPTFSEAEILDLIEVHKKLKYPRSSISHSLLSEISHRLEKAEILSKTFLFQTVCSLVEMREAGISVLPISSSFKLMTEVSKHISSQSVNVNELENVVRALYAVSDSYPVVLIAAVKKKIMSYPRENAAVVSCIRLFEKAKEDYSQCWKFVNGLTADLSSYSIAERLTILHGIYLSKRIAPFEDLEKALLTSIKMIVDEKKTMATLNILSKMISHPNKQIFKSLDFVRKSSLEQMQSHWELSANTNWQLFLSFFTYEGNEDLWRKVISMQTAAITDNEYLHAVNMLAPDSDCIEPALLCIELHRSLFTPEVIFHLQRVVSPDADPIVISKYMKLVDQLDLTNVNKSTLFKGVDVILKFVSERKMLYKIDNFLMALENITKTLTNEADKPLRIRITTLLVNCGKLSTPETLQYVKTVLSLPTISVTALSAAARIWPEVRDSNLIPTITQVLNEGKSNVALHMVKQKMSFMGEIEEKLNWRVAAVPILRKLINISPHLFALLVDTMQALPSRYLSFNPDFVSYFHNLLITRFRDRDTFTSPQCLIKFLALLLEQNIGSQMHDSILKMILSQYNSLKPRDKVELLSIASKFGDAESELMAKISTEIAKNTKEFLAFTGKVLAALSDGGVQNEEWSAGVAESLIFHGNKRLEFTSEDIVQVLMFALRIGMGDNSLTRKLLSLPPPSINSQFTLKRYLLHLHYKDTETVHFSLETELQTMKKEIEGRAWKHFHTEKLLPQESEQFVEKKLAFKEQLFVNDYYVPLMLTEKKQMLWKVPMVARVQKRDALLGDYQFYAQLAKKMTNLDVEIEYPTEDGERTKY